jgi:hypothetical protein
MSFSANLDTLKKAIHESAHKKSMHKHELVEQAEDNASKFVTQVIKNIQNTALLNKDRLAFQGVLCTLLLANIRYKTRDALLLYHTCSAIFQLSNSSLKIPVHARELLLQFIDNCGISSSIVKSCMHVTAIMSPRVGQFLLPDIEYQQWIQGGDARFTEPISRVVATMLQSTSDLDVAAQVLLLATPFMHKEAYTFMCQLAGILAALTRTKTHSPFPSGAYIHNLYSLIHHENLPEHVKEGLNKLASHKIFFKGGEISSDEEAVEVVALNALKTAKSHARTEITKAIISQLIIQIKLISIAILSTLALVFFDSTPIIVNLCSRLASSESTNLEFFAVVLRIILSLGITPKLIADFSAATTSGDIWKKWNATPEFKNTAIVLHKLITEHVGVTDVTEAKLKKLETISDREYGTLAHTQPKSFEEFEHTHLKKIVSSDEKLVSNDDLHMASTSHEANITDDISSLVHTLPQKRGIDTWNFETFPSLKVQERESLPLTPDIEDILRFVRAYSYIITGQAIPKGRSVQTIAIGKFGRRFIGKRPSRNWFDVWKKPSTPK